LLPAHGPGGQPLAERINERWVRAWWEGGKADEKQTPYATTITCELNVTLSGDALRYKGPVTKFIDRFADVFNTRRVRCS